MHGTAAFTLPVSAGDTTDLQACGLYTPARAGGVAWLSLIGGLELSPAPFEIIQHQHFTSLIDLQQL